MYKVAYEVEVVTIDPTRPSLWQFHYDADNCPDVCAILEVFDTRVAIFVICDGDYMEVLVGYPELQSDGLVEYSMRKDIVDFFLSEACKVISL